MTSPSENPADKYFKTPSARVPCTGPHCVGGLQGFNPFSGYRRPKCGKCQGSGAVDAPLDSGQITAGEVMQNASLGDLQIGATS